MSVAGPCEWCGGPQSWTVVQGEIWVSCDGGCAPLPGLGLDLPTDSDRPRRNSEGSRGEPSVGRGVKPLEGGEASTKETVYGDLPF